MYGDEKLNEVQSKIRTFERDNKTLKNELDKIKQETQVLKDRNNERRQESNLSSGTNTIVFDSNQSNRAQPTRIIAINRSNLGSDLFFPMLISQMEQSTNRLRESNQRQTNSSSFCI